MKPGAAHSQKQFRASPRFPAAPTGGPDPSASRSQGGPRLSLSQRVAKERVGILSRICQALDYHAAAGHPLAPHFRKFSRQWRGAFYLAAPELPVRLSAETIRRVYYKRWKRSGRNPEALHYRHAGRGPHLALTEEQRARLLAGLSTVTSLSALYRHVFPTTPCPSATVFFRSFTDQERKALRAEFASQHLHRAAGKNFTKWVNAPTRSFTSGGRR